MRPLNSAAVGLAIRFERERLKITANDLAAQTDITPSSLSRTERGQRMLDLDEADRLARKLGLTVDSLLSKAAELESSGVVKRHIEAMRSLGASILEGRQLAESAAEGQQHS